MRLLNVIFAFLGAPWNWSAKLGHYVTIYLSNIIVKFGLPIPWSATEIYNLDTNVDTTKCDYINRIEGDKALILKVIYDLD